MIRISIDLLPHGDASKEEPLAHIEIVNNGTSKHRPELGNYNVEFHNFSTGSIDHWENIITNYERTNKTWLALVKEVFAKLSETQ